MTELIAEIGWNHMGDMGLADNMIMAAKVAGADYAKFQIFSTDNLKDGPWDQDGRRDIYEKAQLSVNKIKKLIRTCEDARIKFLASVFSVEDARVLASLGRTDVKIPSAEIRNTNLLEFCNDHFDRVFLSTGTARIDEIGRAYALLDKPEVIMFHCVAAYPCPMENANLPRITNLKEGFVLPVGYSDHTEGIEAAKMSLEFGVSHIEKLYTINKDLPGRDNKFAITPSELRDLRYYMNERDKAMVHHGVDYQSCESEMREVYSGRWERK